MQHRHALDVALVDDRAVPRRPRRPVVAPVEGRIDHHALGHRARAVARIGGEVRRRPAGRSGWLARDGCHAHGAAQRARVGIEQQLGGVEAMPTLRGVGTVHAIAVELAGSDPPHVGAPDIGPVPRRAGPATTSGGVGGGRRTDRARRRWRARTKSAKSAPVPLRGAPSGGEAGEPGWRHPRSIAAAGVGLLDRLVEAHDAQRRPVRSRSRRGPAPRARARRDPTPLSRTPRRIVRK